VANLGRPAATKVSGTKAPQQVAVVGAR
jgi:hypothetical protein